MVFLRRGEGRVFRSIITGDRRSPLRNRAVIHIRKMGEEAYRLGWFVGVPSIHYHHDLSGIRKMGEVDTSPMTFSVVIPKIT